MKFIEKRYIISNRYIRSCRVCSARVTFFVDCSTTKRLNEISSVVSSLYVLTTKGCGIESTCLISVAPIFEIFIFTSISTIGSQFFFSFYIYELLLIVLERTPTIRVSRRLNLFRLFARVEFYLIRDCGFSHSVGRHSISATVEIIFRCKE